MTAFQDYPGLSFYDNSVGRFSWRATDYGGVSGHKTLFKRWAFITPLQVPHSNVFREFLNLTDEHTAQFQGFSSGL
jgi:hypothetical protein